jgi:AmmeMemoRadiSam system protein B
VDELLAAASAGVDGGTLKAAIVPHAGYVYSAAVAASVYARMREARDRIRRVVLLGPSHFARVQGLAVPSCDAMQTPLGDVAVDVKSVQRAMALPEVVASSDAHVREHSLEVQLPFLQRALEDFMIVPFAVGDAEPEAVARVIDELWGGDETVVVVSSDFSHYLPYDLAMRTDRRSAGQVLELHPVLRTNEDACGATPINGLLIAASRHNLRPSLLDLRNSGDTAGPRSEVVGYASFAFYESDDVS